MLVLEKHLTLDADTVKAPNLCGRFDDPDLQAIGRWVHDGYQIDKQSRMKWEKRTNAAMDLAMQLQRTKSFPWPNCSNVAFPLITIGAMQFHARAYPAIINGTDIVKMRVVGEDPTGVEHARAQRVSTHMSYQVLEEDQPWEEQQDRLLLVVAIVGCAFKKTYFSPRLRHNVSELVMAKDLIINYWAKSVESCERKTHRVPLSRNEIRERVLSGTYKDVLKDAWFQEPANPEQTVQDQRANLRIGVVPDAESDETTPFYGLEQHCLLDLDGDGYAEPYIITIEEESKTVLRIVSRIGRIEDIDRVQRGPYKGEIVSIRAEEYFTKYSFIPSPDGGIYDIGWGILLGPLNESVDSILNQLVDAGTMSNTAGGFLARGAKIRGGVYTFAPFSWPRVDSTGDDLRKSVFPLPVREPNAVLFQLLGLLVNYTNRISGATDTIVGENPGQNTPAQTTQTMVEMGMKIYSAIFKRIWRAMKEEFRKLYILNGLNLPDRMAFGVGDGYIMREDYLGDPNRVVPVADPNITSELQAFQQATMIKQNAMMTPGYNQEVAEKRWLRAMHADDVEALYPGPNSPNATQVPNPKVSLEQIKSQRQTEQIAADKAMLAAQLIEDHYLNEAKIVDLKAKATKALAEAGGAATNQRVQLINAAIGAAKLHSEQIMRHIEILLQSRKAENDERKLDQQGAVGSVASRSGNGSAATMGNGGAQ